ncbi:unnamed protein product [Penicillium manginii]
MSDNATTVDNAVANTETHIPRQGTRKQIDPMPIKDQHNHPRDSVSDEDHRGENSGKPPRPRKSGKRPASSHPPAKPKDQSTQIQEGKGDSETSTPTDENEFQIIV